MDNNNIIQPTSDLGALDNDYMSWCLLPKDLRNISNGECYAKYGCFMPELYNKYRNAILNAKDIMNAEPSNLIFREDGSDIEPEYENLADKVKRSRQLSSSPFVVLVDPLMNKLEDLNSAYNDFLSLNNKNRRISNDYSWQIWGYSVPEMYKKILAKVEGEYFSLSEAKLESINTEGSVFNMYNHAVINGDIGTVFKLAENVENRSSVSYTIIESLSNFDIDWASITNAPMLTESQYEDITGKEFKIPFGRNYYYNISKMLVELSDNNTEDNTNAILEYGWNPFVKATYDNINEARKLQAIDMQNKLAKVINIENVDIATDLVIHTDNAPRPKLKPLFFVLSTNEYKLGDPIEFKKVGIAFEPRLNFIYTFTDSNVEFTGITVEDLASYGYGIILAAFVDDTKFNQIHRTISKGKNMEKIEVNTNNIFKFMNYTNKYSPEYKKFFYSSVIRALMSIINTYSEPTQLDHPWFDSDINKELSPADNTKVYEVYTGELAQFSSEVSKTVEDKIKLLVGEPEKLILAILPPKTESNKLLESILEPKSIYKYKK